MKGKVIALCLCVVLLLTACSQAVEVTLENVEQAVQTVDPDFTFSTSEEDKPMYAMIQAKDGWIGYLNGTTPVKVYEYESTDAYESAKETFVPMMDDWPVVGNFVLECNNADVQAAFNALNP